MRAQGVVVKWIARAGLAVLVSSLFGLMAAPGAQAAVTNGSLKPFLNCYWDNGDNTVTVIIGINSGNSATVAVPVGPQNQVTQGNPDRGQPETFDPGSRNNLWTFTVSYTEINNGINWQLSGNSVAVDAVNQCSTKPQMASAGSGVAVLAAGALVTLVGGYFLGGPVRSRRQSGEAA